LNIFQQLLFDVRPLAGMVHGLLQVLRAGFEGDGHDDEHEDGHDSEA
jgi:hypothetical protein